MLGMLSLPAAELANCLLHMGYCRLPFAVSRIPDTSMTAKAINHWEF